MRYPIGFAVGATLGFTLGWWGVLLAVPAGFVVFLVAESLSRKQPSQEG